VDCLSCLIVYEQSGVPRTIAAVFQSMHDAVAMIFCGVMVCRGSTALLSIADEVIE
jgi:hypothetical protein